MIFFSAHGVPVSYVENAGDPYRDQMEECIFLIMQELKARGINNEHTLAYQVCFDQSWRYADQLIYGLYSCFCLVFFLFLYLTFLLDKLPEPSGPCTVVETIYR
jgi:hypothetical protein